ncbi:Membrane metalloprotease ARASP chloroplastic [Zea mays]|uniref:Membrane metalloprotease ARASP chloroplastic n=1 Tax=Zea mays TaxID=4577 RepID=K7TMH6_MAIZE|nr:Membrane metalloprotease ARASP chloroplastic [Zea mays]
MIATHLSPAPKQYRFPSLLHSTSHNHHLPVHLSLPRRHRNFAKPTAAAQDLLASVESVASAASVLAAIVLVHESGHFLAAASRGIHVSQFSIGFGPTLARFRLSPVEYALRAIPLGGYVGFPDDDSESGFAPNDLNLLHNRPIPDRLLVVSAGVAANLAFAFLIVYAQLRSPSASPSSSPWPLRPPSWPPTCSSYESGHFLAAASQGIHVSQFSIGFGPTLVRFCLGPVEYALRAIPLDGYVGFPDDDPESGFAPNDPDLLCNRPVPDHLLVVSAGVAANLAFAFLVVYEQALTIVLRRWLGHGCGAHGGRRASDEDVM